MAEFLVIGAVALDRPIRLNGPISPGARLQGRTLEGALSGRLGGGAANAGVALVRAGHRVRLAAFVAADADGDTALATAQAEGLDTSLVHRRVGASPKTLVLIDPAGERSIVHLDADFAGLPQLSVPDAIVATDGLYVRGPYPGAELWAQACRGPVVAHWPAGRFKGPCDVLVASADDCNASDLAAPFAAGLAQVGARLQWLVLTCGPGEVTAYGPTRSVRVVPQPARVVDATGAGDVFAAGLLEALGAGAGIEAALAHACEWGALAVGLEGSAPTGGHFPAFRPVSP